MLSPSPPPPPPPPLFDGGPTAAADRQYSYNPSLMIIAAIVAFAIIAAASIYLLLRSLFLSRSRSPSLIHHLSSSSSSSSSSISLPTYQPSDQDPKAVIDSLPLFSLSSSNLKSSTPLDCAVCLSPFQPSDQLRFLPSCRHAFHSECIDTWLKSSLSCPLCRSAIRPYPMPSPPQPPPPSAPQLDSSRSESFRVEIGSVSRRTDDLSMGHASHVRSYSLGSSFEYVVEEDIEAVLERVRRPPTVEKTDIEETPRPPPPPGPEMADIAGASQRSWLREYVDRLTSSASSSFTSLRFSQRWSQRFDTGAAFTSTTYAAGENWDLERNLHLHLEEDDGGFSAFYRWLIGA